MDGFNAVWAEPANLPSKAEILDPAPGSPGSTAEPPWRCTHRSRPCGSRVRRGLDDLTPGAPVVVACSGGADSLALLVRRGLRGRTSAAGRSSAPPSTTGSRTGSAEHADRGSSPDARRSASTRRSTATASRSTAAGAGSRGRRPAGPLRRARPSRASGFDADAVLLGHTLRRPGRDRAPRAGPRLRRPLAGGHAPRRSRSTAGRCSTSPVPTP